MSKNYSRQVANMAFTDWQQRIIDLEDGDSGSQWVKSYDGTKDELVADQEKLKNLLQDMPVDGLVILRANADASSGVPSGQWVFYYDGTKEEFEADPNYKSILENMPQHSILILNDGQAVDGSGSVSGSVSEATKEWIEENYLKLSGGVLTGQLLLPEPGELPKPEQAVRQDALNAVKATADAALPKTEAADVYATKTELNSKANTSELSDYATKTEMTTSLSSKADSSELSNYLTTSSASSIYATKTDLNDVKSTADSVKSAVNNATTGLAATKKIADDALPKTEAASTYATKTELDTKADTSELSKYFLNSSSSLTLRWGAGNLYLRNNNLDVSTLPESQLQTSYLFVDNNIKQLGGLISTVQPDGLVRTNIRAIGATNTNADVAVYAPPNRDAYAIAPIHTSPEYGNIIVTERALQNYTTQKLEDSLTLHVNADTGDDIADLHKGRGLSEDKPFKTLEACWNYAINNYSSGVAGVTIKLHSDIVLPMGHGYSSGNLYSLTITSDDTKRTINTEYAVILFKITSGNFGFNNVILRAVSISCFLDVGYNSIVSIGTGVEMYGSVGYGGVAYVHDGGTVAMLYGSIDGSVTGKRYTIENGGRILTRGRGSNIFPGTTDGTCDPSSLYY